MTKTHSQMIKSSDSGARRLTTKTVVYVIWAVAVAVAVVVYVIVAFVLFSSGRLEQRWPWMIMTVLAIPLLTSAIFITRDPPNRQVPANEDVRRVSSNKEKQGQFELNVLQTYIDGKLKRLNLLFLVNGGAFAIVQLSVNSASDVIPMKVLATGAIVFTTVMVCDTWLWAQMMKDRYLAKLSFGLPGKVILLLMGLLITVGWLLLGWSNWPSENA